jgi:hypothetical protein
MKKFLPILIIVLCVMTFVVGCSKQEPEPITPVYNMIKYTVLHHYEDENGMFIKEDEQEYEVRVGTRITAEQKNRDHYELDTLKSSTTGVVNENNTIFALYYARKSYTIVLVDPVKGNAQINAKHGKTITLQTRTHEGKLFLGWSYTPDGTQYANITTMPTHNVTLYAVWQDV